MRSLAPALAALLVMIAPASAADLLDGRSLAGWEFIGTPATDLGSVCTLGADGVVAATGTPVGFIATKATHANYRLHAEWRWSGKPGNGGILVHISSGPKDRAWPLCFQVQTKHGAAGDLLPMAGATFTEPVTSAPGTAPARLRISTEAEKPAGEWNTADITCRGDTIEVVINGVQQNRVTGCSLQAGRIGFQFEGAPFELRRVSAVGLD